MSNVDFIVGILTFSAHNSNKEIIEIEIMLKKNDTLDLFFNGPFLNGYGFDAHTLLTEGYEKYQKEIQNRLNETDVPGTWELPTLMEREPPNKLSAPPYVLIEYTAAGDALSLQLSRYNLPYKFYINFKNKKVSIEQDKVADAIFILDRMHVRFTEVGCGSIIQCGHLKAMRDLSCEDARDMAEMLVPYIRDITPMIKGLAEHIFEHSPKNIFLEHNFLKPYMAAFTNPSIKEDIEKQVYIMANAPRVFIMSCKNPEEFEEKRKIARNLLISNSEDYCQNASISEHMDIYAASGSSVITYDESNTTTREQNTLFNVLPIINLFYYATETLTTNIFLLNNSINLSRASEQNSLFANTSAIEEETNAVIEYKAQIDYFLARYNNYDNYLAPQSLRVWREIEELWEAADRQNALKDQLIMTDQIYNRLNNQINNRRSKRITIFLMFFTLLSMLSVIVDTVSFTQEGGLILPNIARIGVLIGMALLFVTIATVLSRKK